MDIEEQKTDLWIDGSTGYNLDKFVEDMASIIIWVSSQQIVVWGVDQESETEWKVTTNEQFGEMVKARWDVRTLFLCCEVVEKDGYKKGSNLAAEQGSKA